MSDDKTTNSRSDETSDSWVTLGSFWSTRRVPGIDDVPETTYVAPPNRVQRRTLIVGSAIALVSVAIGAALVIAGNSGGGSDGGESEVSAAATLTSTSTRPENTTTTTVAPSPSSTSPSTPSTTAAVKVSTAPTPTAAPTPPATANPGLPVYQPVPVPQGVSATLTSGSCSWQAGTLHSAGTITSASSGGRTWTVTMNWLQNNRVLASQSATVDLAPGESKPWSLSVAQPAPPADLACSLAIT